MASFLTSALSAVGYSEDGVDINFDMGWEDVMVDVYGPKVPYDVQYFLQQAYITFDLVLYENSNFNRFLEQYGPSADGSLTGLMGGAGNPFIQNGGWFRLLIKSTPSSTGLTSDEQCWNFIRAYPVDIRSKIGTRRKIHHCTFRALPYAAAVTGGDSTNAVLFNSTCT